MPVQPSIIVENSFINGLVTEATGLNFPDKACSETYDCIFDIDGSVYRRTSFDLEDSYSTKTIDRTSKAIKTYLWQNVAGDGNTTVAVVQIGNKIYFYETNGTGNFSLGAVASTVTITAVSGAPSVDTVEAQFTSGNGFLIVTHPYAEPMQISYDITGHSASASNIILQIRDFEGDINDPYTVDFRPTSTLAALNAHHHYNLLNQGWTDANLTIWDTAQTTMPSNADVMWRFEDTTGAFTASTAIINSVTAGNTPAPNGHYILTLSNQDRATASGVATVPSTTTSFQRPSLCAFFAGRLFYAGINFVGFNSNIYFTQTLENSAQYGYCYQQNDPSSENTFDLLPTDGGVLSIPEAGTIYKMQTVPGGLCIFAANGVWFLTGSTGLGFTTTDYALLKIADIESISDTSFVNIDGYPAWWNYEGIYIIEGGSTSAIPSVRSMTYDTFKSFYDDIPVSSKRYARGFYDKTDGIIRWVYRSSDTIDITSIYEYDRVLNHNLRTKAFYPWTISESSVTVNSVISSELITRPVSVLNVVDGANNVVDSLGNQVVTFEASGSTGQQFDKYLVSYPDGSGSYNISFANRTDSTYLDWKKIDGLGADYLSYFITGAKLRGQALRKFQSNWVEIYSRLYSAVSYRFQGTWDYANNTGTKRWSTNQRVDHSNLDYANYFKRLKVRGHGKAMQFRVSSVTGQPFDIIGWSSLQTVNGAP